MMKRWKLTAIGVFCFAVLMSPLAHGQPLNIPAGVEVDAAGVLRLRTFRDPTGQLTLQRQQQMQAALDPDLARPSRLRKVSLNRLEAAIARSIDTISGVTDDMRYLAGLTRIQYVFLYPETGDIVLAGPAEGFGLNLAGRPVGLTSGRSVIELQDLVVALRCFAPGGVPTDIVGCSIDPTPEGLAKMQQFLAAIAGRITPGDAGRIAKGLKESLGPQMVTVNGVPDNTHFAQVLVEADYRMKLIGIGLERPPVKIPSYVSRANPHDVARNAMQRWYFVPNYESVRVSEDELAMELVGDGVQLIGEHELVALNGNRAASGQQDRASQVFVRAFTKKYGELAKQVPVFAQLRNLIDLLVVSAFLQEHDYYGQMGWNLGVLADESRFPVRTYVPPRQVDSAVNVVWKGNTLMTPIGGGVQVAPKQALDSSNLLADTDKHVEEARAEVDLRELAKGQWWWD